MSIPPNAHSLLSLALVSLLLVAVLSGCASTPQWNQQSRTVSEDEFVNCMLEPSPNAGWGWRYAGSYQGYEYLEYWNLMSKTWPEYQFSVRSRGDRVVSLVAYRKQRSGQ